MASQRGPDELATASEIETGDSPNSVMILCQEALEEAQGSQSCGYPPPASVLKCNSTDSASRSTW